VSKRDPKRDPFYDIYRHRFEASKAVKVECLKTLALGMPDDVRDLVIDLADFWLNAHAKELRKKSTLERDGESFYWIRMYRDMGFSVDQSAQMVARTMGGDAGRLVRAWGDKAKAWKRIDPIASPLDKGERAKLWSKVMN